MRKKLHKKIILGTAIITLSASLLACQTKKEDSDVGQGTEITNQPEATEAPSVTDEPSATEAPSVTEEPQVTEAPEVTEEPDKSEEESTGESESTEEPVITENPEEPTKAPEATKTPDPTKAPTKKPEPTKAPTKKPDPTKAPKPTKKPKPTAVPTQKPEPTEEPSQGSNELTGTLEEIMEQIYSNVTSELPRVFNTEITKDASSYYLGVDVDFEEAIASESMMSIPHSVCLIRVKDGTDIEAVKKDIKANVDPRKWICVGVEPDNVMVDNIGNVIILVMTNSAPNEIMDSFLSLAK